MNFIRSLFSMFKPSYCYLLDFPTEIPSIDFFFLNFGLLKLRREMGISLFRLQPSGVQQSSVIADDLFVFPNGDSLQSSCWYFVIAVLLELQSVIRASCKQRHFRFFPPPWLHPISARPFKFWKTYMEAVQKRTALMYYIWSGQLVSSIMVLILRALKFFEIDGTAFP